MSVLLFGILAVLALITAALMVTARNLVHGVLMMVANFAVIAVMYITLNAPFVAVVQVAVYAGAIMVLFLFIVMLIGEQQLTFDEQLGGQRLYAAVLGLLLAGILLITLVSAAPYAGQSQLTEEFIGRQNVQLVGAQLYTEYLLPFEAASVLLLIAMIGAVVLAKRRLL
ncbi:MAG: NADH-quinone oxidoreductase subunit J [Anaerolineae bacterium]|nr:NADH-quinone oxidoreductase subunit J [Anaerolineae bacterium]